MPPAAPLVELRVTWFAFSISVPAGPFCSVPLAMPPPELISLPSDAFPVTTVASSTSRPAKLNIPPPGPGVSPPVIVRFCKVRFPPGPSTSKMRNGWLLRRAIVAPLPLIVIAEVITGSPFGPSAPLLPALVSRYVHPAASPMVPPPPELAALTAAISPAAPPPGPEHGTLAPAAASAMPAGNPAKATSAPVPAAAPSTHLLAFIKTPIPLAQTLRAADPPAPQRDATPAGEQKPPLLPALITERVSGSICHEREPCPPVDLPGAHRCLDRGRGPGGRVRYRGDHHPGRGIRGGLAAAVSGQRAWHAQPVGDADKPALQRGGQPRCDLALPAAGPDRWHAHLAVAGRDAARRHRWLGHPGLPAARPGCLRFHRRRSDDPAGRLSVADAGGPGYHGPFVAAATPGHRAYRGCRRLCRRYLRHWRGLDSGAGLDR